MPKLDYVLNDPTTPDLYTPVSIPNAPSRPKFSVGGYRGYKGVRGQPAWQAACCYYTMAQSIEMAQKNLKRPLKKWAATNNLLIRPRAGRQLNAYYDRRTIKLFFAKDPRENKLVFTANSTDVVAHEIGHAILDAVRPDLFNVQAMEVWAFHEAFGDIHAVMNMLNHDKAIEYVIKETGGNLRQENALTQLAEEMGSAINLMTRGRKGGHNSLRNLVNNFSYVVPEKLPRDTPSNRLSSESHNFSRVWSGCWYDIFVSMYEHYKKEGHKEMEAVKAARDVITLYTYRALPLAAKGVRFYDAMAKAMLIADKDNGGKFNELMNSCFINRKILRSRVRPFLSLSFEDFKAMCETSDEIHEGSGGKCITSITSDILSLPQYMMNVEAPGDSWYEFDSEGYCTDVIADSAEEIVDHVNYCVDFLYACHMIAPNRFTLFEVDANGNLIRTNFACACVNPNPDPVPCSPSTPKKPCCIDNANNPQAPEYGKEWKAANNSGCGCNGNSTTEECVVPTTSETTITSSLTRSDALSS